ncbi:peroxiredoxin-like family protein [Alteromonas sp. H39]|uniref:peroxiredoxin-like family protein n=1 Tax=Alteromonas sp. H39 TaxID=3389876 RepID=UPI0039E181EE
MMIKKLVCTAILACIAMTSLAHERGTIADAAQNVTPLLNGMSAPNTTLRTPSGAPVSLKAIMVNKPTLVLFYRGGWCPYCNRQLAELKNIEEPLSELGYQIVAISPQTPQQLKSQMLESEFAAQLYSDSSLDTLKGFGIAFYLDDNTQQRYQEHGIALTQDGSGKSVLPAPALFFLDQKGVIEFSYVNPDYKVRPSAELVLAIASSLSKNNKS